MNKSFLKHFALLMILVTLCAALPALALADDDAAKLSVRGTATVSINPDYATLTLGYYVEDASLAQAQADATAAVDNIIAAATALGVEKQDIVTSSLSIGPVYNYNTEPRSISGYRVENMLTITVRKVDDVAAVMNAALEAGANQSYGIEFGSTLYGEAYRRALTEAITIARLKAEAMAEAAGLPLGALTTLNEVQDGYNATSARYSNVMFDEAASGKALGDTIMSGALQVSAQVEMTYELGN